MWANAQRDGRPAEYRWRPLLKATVWLTPTTGVPCSNAVNIRERKTRTKSEFCTLQNIPLGGKSPRKCIYTVNHKNVTNIGGALLNAAKYG